MKGRIIVGAVVCVCVAILLAFLFVVNMEGAQSLGLGFSLLFALGLLLFPLSGLQLGTWVGGSAWLFGGFMGGLVCSGYKRAIVMSAVSILSYIVVVFLTAGRSILAYWPVLADLSVLFPDLLVAFGITVVGALVGARMTKGKPLTK